MKSIDIHDIFVEAWYDTGVAERIFHTANDDISYRVAMRMETYPVYPIREVVDGAVMTGISRKMLVERGGFGNGRRA